MKKKPSRKNPSHKKSSLKNPSHKNPFGDTQEELNQLGRLNNKKVVIICDQNLYGTLVIGLTNPYGDPLKDIKLIENLRDGSHFKTPGENHYKININDIKRIQGRLVYMTKTPKMIYHHEGRLLFNDDRPYGPYIIPTSVRRDQELYDDEFVNFPGRGSIKGTGWSIKE